MKYKSFILITSVPIFMFFPVLNSGQSSGSYFLQFQRNSNSQEEQDKFNQYFDNLEGWAGLAGIVDTDSPRIRIMFFSRTSGEDWDEDPCILILDIDVWKITRFID